MLDIKFVRENPDVVKENIKKKFQDHKLHLVDEVIELDEERRQVIARADELRANRNKISKEIGALMAPGICSTPTFTGLLRNISSERRVAFWPASSES